VRSQLWIDDDEIYSSDDEIAAEPAPTPVGTKRDLYVLPEEPEHSAEEGPEKTATRPLPTPPTVACRTPSGATWDPAGPARAGQHRGHLPGPAPRTDRPPALAPASAKFAGSGGSGPAGAYTSLADMYAEPELPRPHRGALPAGTTPRQASVSAPPKRPMYSLFPPPPRQPPVRAPLSRVYIGPMPYTGPLPIPEHLLRDPVVPGLGGRSAAGGLSTEDKLREIDEYLAEDDDLASSSSGGKGKGKVAEGEEEEEEGKAGGVAAAGRKVSRAVKRAFGGKKEKEEEK
jgi:hypothetical protein